MKKVTTKTQLKKAVENKEDVIIVKGKLAESVLKAKKVAKLSKIGIALLVAALAAAPATGGLSMAAAAPIAVTTGLEATVIISVVAIGGVVVTLAIYQGYDVKVKASGKDMELELKRKK